jgi:hypothetical protein
MTHPVRRSVAQIGFCNFLIGVRYLLARITQRLTLVGSHRPRLGVFKRKQRHAPRSLAFVDNAHAWHSHAWRNALPMRAGNRSITACAIKACAG